MKIVKIEKLTKGYQRVGIDATHYPYSLAMGVAAHKKQDRVSDSLTEPENQSPEIRVNFVFDISRQPVYRNQISTVTTIRKT